MKTFLATILLAALPLAAAADLHCIGLIGSPLPPAGPIPNTSNLISDYLAELPPIKRTQRTPVLHSLESGRQVPVAVERALRLFEHDKCIAVLTDKWIASAFNSRRLIRAAGTANPFKTIPSEFKQMSLAEPSRSAYVVVGWIPMNHPGLDVKKEGDTFVIKMKAGHEGWPQYAFAVAAAHRDPARDLAADEIMDWIASPEASAKFGQWFYVVPDNTRLRRRVRIDLVKDDGTVIASTSCTAGDCSPKPANGRVEFQGTDGKTYSVCGQGAACPQFMPRPDYKLLQK